MQTLRMAKILAATLALGLIQSALGQEGFPLDGTWRGEWGSDPSTTQAVVIVMKWDGESIAGRINPGPRSIDFDSAVLDPGNWTVRIQAKTETGEAIAIEGKLDNIGSYNRTIEGSWTQNGAAHAFKIARE
jgi:hypothetical protein